MHDEKKIRRKKGGLGIGGKRDSEKKREKKEGKKKGRGAVHFRRVLQRGMYAYLRAFALCTRTTSQSAWRQCWQS